MVETPRETGIVRPFRGELEDDYGRRGLPVEGSFREDAFLLCVGDLQFPIPTVFIGVDGHGPFARLEHQTITQGEYLVVIEPEYPEPDDPRAPGLCLSVRRLPPREVVEGIKTATAVKGYSPDEVNRLMPLLSGVAVDFNSLGMVDGSGWSVVPPE